MKTGYKKYLLILGALLIAAAAVWFTHNHSGDDLSLPTDTSGITADTLKDKTAVSPHSAGKQAKDRHHTPSPVIGLNGMHDVTISGKIIAGGSAPCISLENCYNVHITSNKLWRSKNVGIRLYNC